MGLFSRKPKFDAPLRDEGVPLRERSTQLTDHGRAKGLVIWKTATANSEGTKEFAGIRLIEPPISVVLPRTVIQRALAEGWGSVVEPSEVFLTVSPDPDAQPYRVIHYKYVIFHTLDGDVTYEITQNPNREDKAYYGRAV